jgi:hypothetical protein
LNEYSIDIASRMSLETELVKETTELKAYFEKLKIEKEELRHKAQQQMKERDIMEAKVDITKHHIEIRNTGNDDLSTVSEESQMLFYEVSDLLDSVFGHDADQYKALVTKIMIQANRSEGIKNVLTSSNKEINERSGKSGPR